MSLRQQLQDCASDLVAQVPTEIVAAMARADASLAASGRAGRAFRAGAMAPLFETDDVRGKSIKLGPLLDAGPVVLDFFRGVWCPFCDIELRALVEAHDDIARLGGTILAISPQSPDQLAPRAAEIPFPIIADRRARIARSYGLRFPLPRALRGAYEQLGIALPTINASADWLLPIPASYVIDRDGVIVLSFVDLDYRKRLEPTEVLAALGGLDARHKGQAPC